jgi:hypothetical protein
VPASGGSQEQVALVGAQYGSSVGPRKQHFSPLVQTSVPQFTWFAALPNAGFGGSPES